MILECPDCSVQFRVPEAALGATGRRVRCGNCGRQWHAEPPAPADAAPTAPPHADGAEHEAEAAESPPSEPAAPIGDVAGQAAGPEAPKGDRPEGQGEPAADMGWLNSPGDEDRIAQVPALRTRARPLIVAGWALWGAFVAALIVSVVTFRAPLAKAWPPISVLYDSLSLPIPEPAAPVRPAQVLDVALTGEPEWTAMDTGWRLGLSGRVANTADQAVALPALYVVLVDVGEAELQRQRVPLPQQRLPPGDAVDFRAVIAEASANVGGVRFEWQPADETARQDGT